MREIKLTVFVKEGKTYEMSRYTLDREAIYNALANDLINKKLLGCSYIKRITRTPNYDGTQIIKVYYDNNVMCEYCVDDSI